MASMRKFTPLLYAVVIVAAVYIVLYATGATGAPTWPPTWPPWPPVQPPIYGIKETTGQLCSDGFDNDFNGRTDCLDPNCNGVIWQIACQAGANGVKTSICSNGIPVMQSNTCKEVNCNDNIDNDQDGTTDGFDYDCPYMDLLPTGVEKAVSTYVPPNGTADGYYTYDYKVSFKNQGTISVPPLFPNPPPIIEYYKVIAYDASTNLQIGWGSLKAPLLTGQTGWFTITGAKNYAKIKVFVDSDNTHPEPDENNNIETFDV